MNVQLSETGKLSEIKSCSQKIRQDYPGYGNIAKSVIKSTIDRISQAKGITNSSLFITSHFNNPNFGMIFSVIKFVPSLYTVLQLLPLLPAKLSNLGKNMQAVNRAWQQNSQIVI